METALSTRRSCHTRETEPLQDLRTHRPDFADHCGKLDTLHRRSEAVKAIWVYPLARDFRRQLCNT